MTTKKKKKKLQDEEEQRQNPGGGGGGGGSTSTSATTTPGDRISELPVEILHRILGFLEMDKFLIGTSLVSTKWRYLWKSVSTLKFSANRIGSSYVDNNDGKITINMEKNQNFVDHVLRLRDYEASKIEIFNYSSGYHVFGQRDVDANLEWLNNFIVTAVNQGAQEIEITGYRDYFESNIHLNPSIFTSGLLRVFVYSVYNPYVGFGIQFPRSMCCAATHLTHLSLCGIRLPEGGDDSNAAQLHLVFPLLETFIMNFCHTEHLKVLNISAPKLNTLSICNMCMRYGPDLDALGGCRLEIRTPNLTSLDYEGCVYVDCFTENLPRITKAKLEFCLEPRMVEQTTSFAIKLLKGLTSAKTLTLAEFEVSSQDTLKDLLTSFTSLRTLKLITSCKISSIHGMVHFLNSCNSVEKLVWEVVHMYEFVEVEGDEHLMLPQCRLTHLKHVHIKRLCGHKNAIEFVKFLLKSSIVLEDIIIDTDRYSPKRSDIEENLKQFVEENPLFRSIKLQFL